MAKNSRETYQIENIFCFPTISIWFYSQFLWWFIASFLFFFLCCSVNIVWKLIREEKGTYKSIKVCLKSNFILFFMEIDFDLSISARTEQILFFSSSSSLYNPSYIFSMLFGIYFVFFFCVIERKFYCSFFFYFYIDKKKISFKHNHLSFSVQLNNKIWKFRSTII